MTLKRYRLSLLCLVFLLGLAPNALSDSRVELVPLKYVAAGGTNTVAVPGTAEVLASGVAVSSCWVQAIAAVSTDKVYIGGSTVDNTWPYLTDGQSVVLDIDSPADIYIDADTASDGVRYLCVR